MGLTDKTLTNTCSCSTISPAYITLTSHSLTTLPMPYMREAPALTASAYNYPLAIMRCKQQKVKSACSNTTTS